jgi:iron complex outermembrane recepter protein
MMLKQNLKFVVGVACLLLSALYAQAQGTLKGTIRNNNGEPLIGVAVAVVGTTQGTVTDLNGDYALNLNAGTFQIAYSYLGFATVTEIVSVKTGDVVKDVTMASSATQLDEVVVSTGSRNTQRTTTDTPLPIDILAASDLRATGQFTFDKALQYRVPSFNTVNTPVNDATSLLDPYEIRNMGPSRTLILINGKRKNSSALCYIQTSPGRGESGADISAIPADAIKRVEILRDGASAQYGSDAIAGVMNIILKDRYEYGTATLTTGITGEGDGGMVGISINNGANFGKKGYINYTMALQRQALANRPGMVDAQGEANDFGAPLAQVQSFLRQFPDAGNINGQPENAAAKFLVNGGIPIDNNTEIYYNAAYVYKKVNSFANYRTPYWRTTDDGLLTPRGQPYIGYVPTFEGDLNDYNATIGFRSTSASGWNTDVSFTTGGNSQLYTVANSRNRSLGKNSPILFRPGGYGFFHNVGNVDISKSLSDRLNFAFGAEFRAEKFEITAGDTASYSGTGADSFPGIGAPNAGESTRYNFGGYVDLGFDITENFLLNGTARLEQYSDFGEAFVWKLSSRYKMADNKVTLRGSISTGFRAPSLHQINLQLAQASFVPGQGIQTKGIVNNRSSQARLLDVPQLKPEKSTNITLGLGFQPSKKLNITLDYYNISLKDRIVLSSEIMAGGTAASRELDAVLNANGIVAVSFFINGMNTRTSGLDLVANYRGMPLGKGTLNFNLAGNYQLQNERTDPILNPELIARAGQTVVDQIQEALLLSSRPKFKYIVGADWVLSKFSLNLNNTVFGPTTFRQNGLNSNLKTVFKTKLVTDLGANIALSKTLNLGVNIQNILNVLPEWELKALNSAGEAVLRDPAQVKNNVNAITFNGRYSMVTYDGSHFSQLGRIFTANLALKF